MLRRDSRPRKNWRAALKEYPYGTAAAGAAAHWQESACYEFSADEIDHFEEVANEVYGLVHDTVRHAIESHLLPLLGLSPTVAGWILSDWQTYWNGGRPDARREGLYGRLDFAYDGQDSLKLIACSTDTPAGLFDASIVQWNWLQALHEDADQFNGLHESLVERIQSLAVGTRGRDRLHLTCATPDRPSEGELAYLAAVAEEAGLAATIIPIQEIGWDGSRFRDLEERDIRWLLKAYPWEALVEEQFGAFLNTAPTTILDPLWRMPASNHGLLATLWELYPEHPNLCPAALSRGALPGNRPVLERSLFGLDRAASRLVDGGRVIVDTGPAVNPGGTLYLSLPPTYEQGSVRAVLQCWMVGDRCLGLSVREAEGALVGADGASVPHLFR